MSSRQACSMVAVRMSRSAGSTIWMTTSPSRLSPRPAETSRWFFAAMNGRPPRVDWTYVTSGVWPSRPPCQPTTSASSFVCVAMRSTTACVRSIGVPGGISTLTLMKSASTSGKNFHGNSPP